MVFSLRPCFLFVMLIVGAGRAQALCKKIGFSKNSFQRSSVYTGKSVFRGYLVECLDLVVNGDVEQRIAQERDFNRIEELSVRDKKIFKKNRKLDKQWRKSKNKQFLQLQLNRSDPEGSDWSARATLVDFLYDYLVCKQNVVDSQKELLVWVPTFTSEDIIDLMQFEKEAQCSFAQTVPFNGAWQEYE